jgi:MFS family permease
MSPPPKRSPVGVLFLTVFTDLLGFSIIFPLFPQMLEYYLGREGNESAIGRLAAALGELAGEGEKREFYTAVLFGGVVGSLYSILQFAAAPLWGRLSDRIGRRPVLLLTIGGLAASYLLWVFSGSFALLVLSRLLGGVMGGNIAVATAAMADATHESKRARGMGLIGAAFGLGFIVGPAIGGGLSMLDLAKVTGGTVPGINPFSAAAAGACLLSVWNVIWVAWRFEETLPPVSRGAATTSAARARRPLNPLVILRGFDLPGVTQTNLAYFLFLLAFAGMEFTLTFLAVDRFDYTPRGNAAMFVFVGVVLALVQGGVVRRAAPRYGEKRVAIAGLALVVPGLVITGASASQGAFYAGLAFLAVGSALATACLTALVSLYTPPDRQGEVLGAFRSLGALSRAIGPLLACAAYWKLGAAWPYYGGAVVMAVPLLLALGLPLPRGAAAQPSAATTEIS